jgi:hypothetical protein
VANTTLAYDRGRLNTGGVSSWASPGSIAGDLDRLAGEFVGKRDVPPSFPPPQSAARLAEIAPRLQLGDDPMVRQDLARLYTLERLTDMTGQRANALVAQDRELLGLPQLTKMAQKQPGAVVPSGRV